MSFDDVPSHIRITQTRATTLPPPAGYNEESETTTAEILAVTPDNVWRIVSREQQRKRYGMSGKNGTQSVHYMIRTGAPHPLDGTIFCDLYDPRRGKPYASVRVLHPRGPRPTSKE